MFHSYYNHIYLTIIYLFQKNSKLCSCIQESEEGASCISRQRELYIFDGGVLDEAKKTKEFAMKNIIELDEQMVDIESDINLVQANLRVFTGVGGCG